MSWEIIFFLYATSIVRVILLINIYYWKCGIRNHDSVVPATTNTLSMRYNVRELETKMIELFKERMCIMKLTSYESIRIELQSNSMDENSKEN